MHDAGCVLQTWEQQRLKRKISPVLMVVRAVVIVYIMAGSLNELSLSPYIGTMILIFLKMIQLVMITLISILGPSMVRDVRW